MQKKREEIGRTPFTTRLQNAIVKHQMELQELFDRMYSAPRPELAKSDLEMVRCNCRRTCLDSALSSSLNLKIS